MPANSTKQQPTDSVQWETIACPVCLGETFTTLFEKQNEPFVKCSGCGLVLINPRPVYDQVLDTYDNNYSQIYASKADKKLRRIRRWVNRIVKKYGARGRWLDIGCSVGFVVKAAEEAGFEGYGVDVQSWGIEYGQNQLGLKNLSYGMLEEQKYQDNFFQVISLYDVIEHVPDLNSLVAEITRILAPGGIIDIITPDVGHWRVPAPLRDWGEIKPSEHLYYFNINTLSQLLERHGIKIIKKRFSLKPSLKVYAAHSTI